MPSQIAPGIRKEYLHLSLYRCANCRGPVVAASTGTRASEIARETDIRPLGAACLSCGDRQPADSDNVHRFPPVEWEIPKPVDAPQRPLPFSRPPRTKFSAKERPFEEEEASSRMVDEGCPIAKADRAPAAS